MQNISAHRTDEQIQQDNADVRVNIAHFRETQSQEVRDERNRQRRLEQRQVHRYVVKYAEQLTNNANNKYIEHLHRIHSFN
ncbi:hypothetical protein CEXT_729291 [Caerostris extrusa]|uniref:Uncharacterized protein n=1 Tax=Caerostris extrusa TaxID=172846 RepID=A0AAV4PPJ0_CAEEX|nr:hypothetical protein CEXT_729291 [Caerostris extrusa]